MEGVLVCMFICNSALQSLLTKASCTVQLKGNIALACDL